MKLARLAVLLMAVSGSLAAEDVKFVGTITQTVKSTPLSPVTAKASRRAVVTPTPQIKNYLTQGQTFRACQAKTYS
ncbi:hypothetical protein [Legionella tunisiensis]|uniref:hypothetical protein n=1 Tax=Legionella tunisiensis TaxID=1034944 RepID=UPI00030A1037|nr:hypothetical protein [Legionella tunisiensis]